MGVSTSKMARFPGSLVTLGALLVVSTANAQGPFGGYGNGDGNGYNGRGPWGGNGNGCGWWGGSDCNGSNSDNDDLTSNGLSQNDVSRNARIVTVHAVLASMVWVFLIPVGGILIRSGVKSPWVLRLHALLQSISYLIYIVAVAMGIWLVGDLSYGPYSLWDDAHTKLGIAILVIAFVSPITGIIHHKLYKRRAAQAKEDTTAKPPGRTIAGHIHLWFGRVLIVLGMVNGGLGLRLAARSPYYSNGKAKAIAYGVGAAIMLILYIAFAILGEIWRRRDQNQAQTRSAPVPMMNTAHDVNGEEVPPTYDMSQSQSQESLGKHGAVARYS